MTTDNTSDPIDHTELDTLLERLFSLQTFGIKLGMEPVTALLHEFGDPHLRFPTIHVAGTNGKGSVCAMIASILQQSGLRVGLYTSPHLVGFEERIRIDGIPIPLERLALYTREMMPAIERIGCTFFEGTTAIGFRYFAEERVDIAVIETGMGGRLDATNVVVPLVSAITSISLDHTKHLGDTLEKIAFEKAGIIKPGVPAVVGKVEPRLREIFLKKGRDEDADVRFVDELCRVAFHDLTFDHTLASFIVGDEEFARVKVDLVGRHQTENARVALATVQLVRERFGLDGTTMRDGLERIRANTGIHGRFELVRNDPTIILDVAHNPDGARVLVDTLGRLVAGKPIVRFVFGAVEDKDIGEIVSLFGPLAARLYAVRADSPRSLPAAEIAIAAERAGIASTVCGSVAEGIETALEDILPGDVLLVCGSFFVVGEATGYFSRHEGSRPGLDRAMPTTTPPEASRKLTVREWSPGDQPRERLMKLGAAALTNAELLAILLRTGTRAEDVVQLSRSLLRRFDDSLADLSSRDYRELQGISGIGPAKAVTLAAAFEIAGRIRFDPFSTRPKIESPEDVAQIYIPKLRGVRKEQFHVLILNSANQVVRTELVSEGNLNSSIVHPREVFRTAIVERAAAIIGLHNHPSGNPTASKEDIAVTRQLVEAGRILGITFHDHIIIAGESHVSLKQEGYM